MGVSVLLRLFISSNEVCNTAYALWRIHEQNSIFKDSTIGPVIPKEMKYNLHYGKTIKTFQISRPIAFEPSGAVAQLLECPVCVRDIVGSIPGRVIPKTLKMVLLLFRLRSALRKRNWSVRCQYNVTGWNFTSFV